MTRPPIPVRYWRSYGNDPLPTGAEATDEPFNAFPSWFLRIERDRCGKVQMINETHFARPKMPIRDIIAKLRPRRLRRQGREGGGLTGIGRAEAQPACFRRRTAGWMSTPLVAKGERTGADNACES